jgi:hypothetical protein
MQTKEQVRAMARDRLKWLDWHRDEHWGYEGLDDYERLLDLISSGSLGKYVKDHGLSSIDEDSCAEVKRRIGFGMLSRFERDAIILLNANIDRMEVSSRNRIMALPPPRPHL